MRRAPLLLLILAVVIAGTVSAKTQESVSGADDAPPQTVTIYTYDSFPEPLESIIAEAVEAELGVELVVERFQDTGGLYNQLWFEREDPKADVVIGLDTTYMTAALETELFRSYRPESSDLLRSDLVVDDEYRLVPYDWGHIVLNYNSEMLPDPPQSWEGLLDPSLRDSIIVLNPATSSPGRAFLQHTIHEFGEEGFLEFWEQLKPNILTVASGWSDGYGLYVEGEAPIVVSYETSPVYHLEFEDDERYKNLIFDDEGYAQIELAGILAASGSPEAAELVMDTLLSTRLQAELPMNQFMYPVRIDVEVPEPFQRVSRASRSVQIPIAEADEGFAMWLNEWQAVMQ